MSVRIGGVPEHFNIPWKEVLAGRDEEWVEFAGGSGAMARAIESGDLDVAVMLTESAVRAIARGLDAKIVGTHVHSPLRWGVHRAADSHAELNSSARFAISRFGSGSHLIPCVVAAERGWQVDALAFVEVGNVAGGRDALVGGTADLFLWEQFMTQPLVDAGDLERIDVYLPPWPSFMVVASPRARGLTGLLDEVEAACARRRNDVAATVIEISGSFGIRAEHASEWLTLTDWRCSASVPAAALQRATGAIERAFGAAMPAVADLVDCDLISDPPETS